MKVEKSIVINRPIADVFAFVTDMSNVSRWTPVREIKQTSTGPMQVGTTYVQVGEFMGQQLTITTQISAYNPPALFGFKAISGPFPLESTFTFSSVDEGTQVTLVGEGQPTGLKFAGGLMAPMIKKQLDTQLHVLKQLLESQ